MRKRALLVVTALVAGAALGLGPTAPAGAAVTVTSSGTAITATITGSGHGTIGVSCVSGQARVLNVAATPSVGCAALTAVSFTTDDTSNAFGPPYPYASFPALVTSTIDAGSGADRIELSPKGDIVDAGGGIDTITLPWGGADDTIDTGGQSGERVEVTGTSAGDGATITTPSPAATTTRLSSGTWQSTITGPDFIDIDTLGGGDIISAASMSATSTLDRIVLDGGDGDDILLCGPIRCTMFGGSGTNTLTGGAAGDSIGSSSRTDTVRGAGSADGLGDIGQGPFGGRTYDSSGNGGAMDVWGSAFVGDTFLRTRSAPSGGAVVLSALSRTGRQDLDAGIGQLQLTLHGSGQPTDRVVVDASPLTGHPQAYVGSTGTALDVVVPTGSWTVSSSGVSFTGPYEAITFTGGMAVAVRTPFTNPTDSFAHRVIRDLYLRLPTPAERTTLRDQLTAGTTTRAQAVLARTSTDGYRGLAVDRAFVDILRRATDLDGRSYWIGRLRVGLVTRRLRANLYGTAEYYSDAGNTPKLYVAAAYRDILGRTAPQSDIDYWAAQITDVGLTKGTVADRFLNTPEARQVLIRDLFLRWVLREPTADELSTWSPQVASSSTDGEVALIRFLAGSTAYSSRGDS